MRKKKHKNSIMNMEAHVTIYCFLLIFFLQQCASEPSKKCKWKCRMHDQQDTTKNSNVIFTNSDLIGELCERTPNFPSTYRKIDGAEIISKNERNLDCLLTFQTHSILQRFMIRFDGLNLDCNDHCE